MATGSKFKYDVFLSYSFKDKEKVHALAQRLKQDGLRVWLDAWAIRPGDSIPLKIQQGLEQSRVLLMCMSPDYFASDCGRMEHLTLLDGSSIANDDNSLENHLYALIDGSMRDLEISIK